MPRLALLASYLAAAACLCLAIDAARNGRLVMASDDEAGVEAREEVEEEVEEEADDRAEAELESYEAQFPGWYWIYQGVAHAQQFVARGSKVTELRIRAAKLNETQPAAQLVVEIRDPSLGKVCASGAVRSEEARLRFRWINVTLVHAAPLDEGGDYVLLFHSPESDNEAPWVVNAVYRSIYPCGRHLGYDDDVFFAIAFEGGRRTRVGPGEDADRPLPTNSGSCGGCPVGGPLALHFPSPHPKVADDDPMGPVPDAEYVWYP